MKKFIAVLIAAFVALLGLAGPATADSATLPYGGTATLTIPDVTLAGTGPCVSHYGTFSISHPDYWNVDITANGPTTWPATDYLYGTGPGSRVVELILCPSTDGPGLYTATGLVTVEDPYSYNQQQVFVSDQFVISRPAPPAPAPAPPAPAPVYADVTGSVSSKMVTRGVKLTFKTNALPAGATQRNPLAWKVVADGKVKKSFTQTASNIRSTTLRYSADTGKHVVKVLRNGTVVKTVRFRA
jgi:hypothetical protein